MHDTLEYMQKRARERARSGKHVGWRSVAFELQFEPSLKQVFWFYRSSGDYALQWLHSPATKAEMDASVQPAGREGIPLNLTLAENENECPARGVPGVEFTNGKGVRLRG